MERNKTRCSQLYYRCNNDAQLFHHVEWLPGNAARRFELDCHERVGRRVHVLHLRESSRVRLRELRRPQTADAQRCLSSGREPRHPGTLLTDVLSIEFYSDAITHYINRIFANYRGYSAMRVRVGPYCLFRVINAN